MNDYRFGNFLYEQRKKSGLSQNGLAQKLGISGKAVSKWETGKAKPTTDTLRKLAGLFDIPIGCLLDMREKRSVSITKIVITGGPCAGKTTAMSRVQDAFSKMGYTVLFVPETATELITGGVAPWTCKSNAAYQECQMRLQAAKEQIFEQAAELDDRLIAAWTGHPHLRVIDNTSGFEKKMCRLISEISSFLGEPEPFEIERKFLIEYPDLSWLENNPSCRKVEIIQTYLKSENGDEVRVRQRGENGHYMYYQTTKRKVSDIKRIEVERRLSQTEYLTLLMEADTAKRQIRKTRYCLTYENRYFEIDVYPFWNDKAIAEIELSDENIQIVFPEQIKVIKEVTEDESYKNASLAQM